MGTVRKRKVSGSNNVYNIKLGGMSCELKDLGHGLFGAVLEITPAMAEKWMDTQVDNQRNVKRKLLNDLILDINRGSWFLTGEPILFNEDGKMCNGQHRCSAIIKSGTPSLVLCVFGVERDVMHALDSGKVRTVRDSLTIAGEEVSAADISIMRSVIDGFRVAGGQRPTGQFTKSMWQEIYPIYQPVLKWFKETCELVGAVPGKELFTAGVAGAFCRAYFVEDTEKLERGIEVLQTGRIAGEHERAMFTFRDNCLKSMRDAYWGSVRIERYVKASRSIKSFCADKVVKSCHTGKICDIYPQPLSDQLDAVVKWGQ